MKRFLWLAGACALFVGSAVPAQAGAVGYTLDVITFYQFGAPANLTFADFGTGSPDTGYWTVTNNGASTFSGTIGQTAVTPFGADFSYSHSVTLAPGQSVTFAVNSESSNQGGYNGAFGSVQNGVTIGLNGTISLGANSEPVTLSVNDADIHSGVINGGGQTDAYVLQGGNPFGFDNGDAIETTQANGHFEFFEQPMTATPEPASLALLCLGVPALVGYSWKRRQQAKSAA
jgi:hypothetical protein